MSWNQWQGGGGWQQPQQQQQQQQQKGWGGNATWAASNANTGWGNAQQHAASGGWGASQQQVQVPARAPQPQRYLVYSTANDMEDFVMKTICGEFVHNGENHGKPSFQKQTTDGSQCFIYYWDSRDGPSFEGWWFGRQVGGNEVWSHNAHGQSPTPPGKGWKVPFAGPVRESLVVITKAEHDAHKSQQHSSKLNAIWHEVEAATSSSNATLSEARDTAAYYDDFAILTKAEALLAPQIKALGELQQKVNASGTDPLQNGSQELAKALASLNQEKQKIQNAKPLAQEAQRKREADSQDAEELQKIMEEATTKCNEAEDLVEKAGIAAEMIEAAGSDTKEAQSAISTTEKAAKDAQDVVTKTLSFMNTVLSASKLNKLKSPDSKKHLGNEISTMRTRLMTAQTTLGKLKNLRTEYNQKQLAKATAKEVLDKLTVVEVEVDKVEELAATIGEQKNPSKADQAEFEKKITAANNGVSTVLKLIDIKKQKATFDAGKVELEGIEARTRKCLPRLASFRTVLQTVKEKLTTGSLLSDVGEKVNNAENSFEQALEAQGQEFLSGIETMPLEDTLTDVKNTEAAVATTSKLINTAKIAIRMKDVETKRFSEAAAQEAKAQLGAFMERLETLNIKLDTLKATCAERKRGAIKTALETRVSEAEDQAQKLAEAAAFFADEGKSSNLSTTEVRAAASAFAEAHAGTASAITTASELVTQQQIANKSAEVSPSDSALLSDFQARLRRAQATQSAHQTLPEVVERQILVNKAIEEAEGKIQVVEEKVSHAVEAGRNVLNCAETADDEETYAWLKSEFDKAHANAQTFLKTLPKFMDLQKKSKQVCKAELEKLEQERLGPCQEKLDEIAKSLQNSEDERATKGVLKEVEAKVDESEAGVAQAEQVAQLLDGEEAEADSSVLAKFDRAVQAANKVLTAAKTFIAVKRLATKRMTGSVQAATLDGLQAQQGRIDKATEKLNEIRRASSNRKFSAAKKEVVAKIQEAEAKVKAVTDANISLGKAVEEAAVADEMNPLMVKGEFLAASKARVEAQEVVDRAQQFVRDQLRALQSKNAAADAIALDDFRKLLEELVPLQASLDKEKDVLTNNEQQFVAHRLRKGADKLFFKLEESLEKAKELAEPLISEKKADFVASILLSQVMTKVRAAVKKAPADVYKEMRGGDTKLLETRFVDFVAGLSENGDKAGVSDEQLKSAFAFMSKGAGAVDEKEFVLHLKPRYLCVSSVPLTAAMKVDDKEPICTLEVGDVVEGIEDAVLDEDTGMLRMRVRCEADGSKGFATVSGNGSAFLEAYSLYGESQSKLDVAFQDCNKSLDDTMAYLKSKTEEIKTSDRSGPLVEVRNEFTKLRVKASKEQNAHALLEKRVGEAKKLLDGLIEAERRRTQEAVDRAAAAALLKMANESVQKVVEEVERSFAEAESLLAKRGKDRDDFFEAMATTSKDLEAGIVSLGQSLDKTIRPKMDELPSSGTGPLAEARKALYSLRSKLTKSREKSKKLLSDLQAVRDDVSKAANLAVRDSLRDHLLSTDASPHDLFAKIAGGKDKETLTVASLQAFMQELASGKLSTTQLQLGLHRYATGGVSKLDFLMMAQEFLKCIKEVAITNVVEVRKATTVRKLDVGEIVSVIGERGKDKAGLERVRCRAISDGAEGFVTLKGNVGATFMKPAMKPLYITEETTPLFQECDSFGEEVCRLSTCDVLEVIEGPKQAPTVEVQRVRGRAQKDGKTGWINVKDITKEGQKRLACNVTTAFTDCFDVGACKAVRKIEVGEVLLQLEDSKEDSARKLVRVHAKAKKDGTEGWATMKGNQGTEYLVVTDAHRECIRPTDLQSGHHPSSRVLRSLDEGEEFEVLEGPKPVRLPGVYLKKCRSLSSGSEGWLTSESAVVSEWTPIYKCVKGIELKAKDEKKTDVVRSLEVDEILHALRPPSRTKDGALVLKVRAEKDGAIGFASLKDDSGTVLKPMLRD